MKDKLKQYHNLIQEYFKVQHLKIYIADNIYFNIINLDFFEIEDGQVYVCKDEFYNIFPDDYTPADIDTLNGVYSKYLGLLFINIENNKDIDQFIDACSEIQKEVARRQKILNKIIPLHDYFYQHYNLCILDDMQEWFNSSLNEFIEFWSREIEQAKKEKEKLEEKEYKEYLRLKEKFIGVGKDD